MAKEEFKSEKFLDIEKAIKDKNPRLLKLMPRFLLRYMKRIIHQDDMNQIIENAEDKKGLLFIKSCFKDMGITYEVDGEENIPSEGRFLFISNHPLGGLDGMVLIDLIGEHHPDVKFVVNDLLMNIKKLQPVFAPVNKHGRQSTEYARILDDMYSSNSQVLYFPAGLCSRKIKGKIVDLDWKKTIVTKAIKYKRDIIPIFFEGRNSNFFYNLSNFRKRIGVKANIEMFYLVNEMFKQSNKKLRLKIGQPIPWQTFNKSRNAKEWTDALKKVIYALGAGENANL